MWSWTSKSSETNSEQIVRDEFPPLHTPPSPQPFQTQSTQILDSSSQKSANSDDSTNKENAPPAPAPEATEPTPGTLPSQLQQTLNSIILTFNTFFLKYPPHTIQRFAELIIEPKRHYRTLPTYLYAVDRVVHVTSGANLFPLPPAIPDPSSAAVLSNGASLDPLSISWGNATSSSSAGGLGSDESLGGALLTPISWLSNGNTRSPLEGEVKTESTEMIEGPNGMGGVETVSVSVNGVSSPRGDAASVSTTAESTEAILRAEGGVTQGELLRQEQRAGVVPVAQLSGHRGEASGEDEEMPHARGPDEIGMEDTGPQSAGSMIERGGLHVAMQGIDVEAAVGRRAEVKEEVKPEEEEAEVPGTPKREAEEALAPDAKRPKEDVDQEDVEVIDTNDKSEEERKAAKEEEVENKEADVEDPSNG